MKAGSNTQELPGASVLGLLSNPGEINLHTSSVSYSGTDVSDFTAETRIRMDLGTAGGEYGFVLRGGTPAFNDYNDWMNALYVGIVQGYDVSLNQVTCASIGKYVNGVWTSLGGICSPAILFDDWNTLKVYMKGSILKVYVNDALLLNKVVTWQSSGKLGVYSYAVDKLAASSTYVDWVTFGGPVLSSTAVDLQSAEDDSALIDEIRKKHLP